MADLTPISLASGTNRGRYDFEASARLVNCYVEALGQGGKNQFALYAINGWEQWATLPGAAGGVRGMLSLDSELLVVAGRGLYSVSPSQAVTLIGGIASDGLVTMARNRQSPDPQAVIVSEGQWYIYQGGTLTPGSDPDLRSPIYVTQKDGYFVFLAADGTFTLSGIDDTTIDGLDFANAQSSPDGGVALATRGTDLIIFGQNSTEFYTNTGNPDFPFERQAYRGFGCYTAGSVAEITAQIQNSMVDSVIWAATDEKGKYTGIYMLTGYEAQKISNYDIDREIEKDPSPGEIRAFGWTENGHVFYNIKGSTYSHTFDTVEGVWHDRQSATKGFWRAVAHETFRGQTIFGNSENGTLYRSSIDLYDAAGETVEMEIRLPLTHAWPYELICNRFAVDSVPGVGLVSSDAHLSDPQIMFDYSTDGGRNFGLVDGRSLGAAAQTMQNLEWWALGTIPRQGTVFRLRISSGVRRCVMGVAIDVDKLAA